jgi:aryl-alcohol dehydrogenase-like predicted oxidoreductase
VTTDDAKTTVGESAPPVDPERYFAPRVDIDAAPLVLGTMNFGKRTSARDADAIVARAWERGVRLYDTANVYGDGESERILGRALRGRVGALVATKVGLGKAEASGKPEGLAPERIEKSIGRSLERLGVDAIDLYYLHAPDLATPIDRTLDALEILLQSGKVRRWGVSNYASWQVLDIFHRCDARSIPRPCVSQVIYNLLVRQLEIEWFAFAQAHPIHTTVYNPLAGGFLSGRHARGASIPKGSRFDGNAMYQRRYWSEPFFELLDRYRTVAEKESMTLVELAYAWVAGRRGVDSILAGPGSLEHLDAALDGIARPLSKEARRRIDGIHLGFVGTDARYARLG